MTPAESLRDAARRLRELSTAATPGEWEAKNLPPNDFDPHHAFWVTTEYTDEDGTAYQTVADCPWRMADAEYIAAVRPSVGMALAELLEDLADGEDDGQVNPIARALARVLNRQEDV